MKMYAEKMEDRGWKMAQPAVALPSLSSILHLPSSRFRRTAFSFAEVMFAVVILGIGFIMIAAIFPVAIQQSQTTNDESLATAVARESAATISQLSRNFQITQNAQLPNAYPNPLYDSHPPAASQWPDEPQFLTLFPPTVKNHVVPAGAPRPPAVVAPLSAARWDYVRSNLILSSDSRYAYVPFYRRENGSNVAQLIVIAVTARNRSTYEPNLDTNAIAAAVTLAFPPNLIAGAGPTIFPDNVTITGGAPRPGYYVEITRSGTDSATIPNTLYDHRTYRLGRPINYTAGTFELEAPDDTRRTSGPITAATDSLWGTIDDIRDNRTAYVSPKLTPVAGQSFLRANTTLQPAEAFAQLTFPTDSLAGRITLYDMVPGAGGQLFPPDAAAEGAFVIIADDYPYDPATYTPTTGNDTGPGGSYTQPATITHNPVAPATAIITRNTGQSNGRIYRLGRAIPPDASAVPPIPPGTYDLDPSYGMTTVDSSTGISADQLPLSTVAPNVCPYAKVYLVGRGRTTPNTTTDLTYSGAAQDIAIYTTFIPAQ